jgi:7,8-dihydroneopterin aldolase/epimerase/oxygenase
MDKIIIRELAVFYRVGVPEEERKEAQRLLLSLEMTHDFAAAAAADDLSHSIDYDALSKRLRDFGRDKSWKLIETLAVDLAEMILRDFKPVTVFVEVQKFVIPDARYVAVSLTRTRQRD